MKVWGLIGFYDVVMPKHMNMKKGIAKETDAPQNIISSAEKRRTPYWKPLLPQTRNDGKIS
jgi:hypothetical protein